MVQEMAGRGWTEEDIDQMTSEMANRQARENAMDAEDERDIVEGTHEYFGHDMSEKPATTGLRLVTYNARGGCIRKLDKKGDGDQAGDGREWSDSKLDIVMRYMRTMQADIMVLQDPGEVERTRGMIRATAEKHELVAEVFHGGEKAENVVVLMTRRYGAILTRAAPDPSLGTHSTRKISLEFTAGHRQEREPGQPKRPLQRMLIQAVYGYNNPAQCKELSNALWDAVVGEKQAYLQRKENSWAAAVVVGDLNAAKSSALDTDREGQDRPEKEAGILHALQGAGMHDIFREHHNTERAWSRVPPQALQHQGHAARRIDHMCATAEIAQHPAVRIGIHRGGPMEGDSDHMPVLCDMPIDCTGMAEEVCPIWSPTVVYKLVVDEKPTAAQAEAFNKDLQRRVSEMPEDLPTAGRYQWWTEAIQQAVVSTMGRWVKKRYPKQASKLTHYRTCDYHLRAWKTRLKGLLRAIEEKDRVKIRKAARRAAWRRDTIQDTTEDTMEDLDINLMAMDHIERRAKSQLDVLKQYLSQKEVRARAEAISEAAKKRKGWFEDPTGKGRGSLIKQIFKTSRVSNDLTWARKQDGTLASSPEDVAQLVRSYFEEWMASRVSVQTRWGSWENLRELDTSQIDDTKREVAPGIHISLRDMVQECYINPSQETRRLAGEQDWWGQALKPIPLSETQEALDDTTAGTAAGPSQVSIDTIKTFDEITLVELTKFFNLCLQERKVPHNMNSALMRLIPKTETGFYIDKTRPIALMETIAKLYERIIIKRVTAVLEEREVLDPSQFGAVARAGVQAPLRTVAEIMEDSRKHEKELHLTSLDLSHAFDSEEYHSQYLTWKCLGLPEELIGLLINLDAGNTSILIGGGRTTAPFAHGRGVRQGSVGGPLKWICFMHFWLRWIKTSMKGKGYTMEGTDTEFTAQMFVDDSIWAAHTRPNMQETLRRNELFCEFHQLYLNKQKTKYIRMYDQGFHIHWMDRRGDTSVDETPQQRKARQIAPTGRSGPVRLRRRHITQVEGQQVIRPVPRQEQEDGREFKYLGVWFEAEPGWKKQATVLQEKHDALVASLQHRKMPLEQIVYLINTKIIPAIAYPLQVAIIPAHLLTRWDTVHRKLVRSASGMPLALPRRVYHLPVAEFGGLGLKSVEMLVHQTRIKLDMQARNETDQTKQKWTRCGTNLDNIVISSSQAAPPQTHLQNLVEAAWEQPQHDKHSVCGGVQRAMQHLGVEIKPTPRSLGWASQHRTVLLEEADKVRQAGVLYIYTDGATIPGERTGWGFVIQDERGEEIHAHRGRLRGAQSNDIAEAMALLQALQAVHMDTPASIYIDNTGVLDTSKKPLQQDHRARSRQTARAVWNRIILFPIIKERQCRGSYTSLSWIHSHTDNEERKQWNPRARYQCACGGQGRQECDPMHRHHLGNERADELAKEGMHLEPDESQRQLHPLAGEDQYYLKVPHGDICQGDSSKFLQTCTNNTELATLRDEGKAGKHSNEFFYEAWRESSTPIRKKVTQSKVVSLRFRIRLWTDTLPTYARIGKMAETQGAYREVYGDTLQGGQCPWCPGHQETMAHILQVCPQYADTRAEVIKGAKGLWKQAKCDWLELDWITDLGAARYSGWDNQWSWEGQVPHKALQQAYKTPQSARHVHSLMNATATHMLQGAWRVWEARNTAKEAWEAEVGIKEKKQQQQKKGWQPPTHIGPKRKRGRPRLELHELTSKAAITKRRLENDLQQFQDTLGDTEGQRRFNLWKKDAKVRNKLREASKGAAVAPLQLKGIDKPVHHGPCRKPQSGPAVPAGAICDVNTCDNAATTKGWGCSKASWRCKAHDYLRCKGAKWVNSPVCDCQAAVSRRGVTARRQPRQPQERKRPERHEDLRIGDTIAMLPDEGWLEGSIEIVYMRRRGRAQRQLHKVITATCEVVIGEEGREGWDDIEWQLVETKEERAARESAEVDSDSDTEATRQGDPRGSYLCGNHGMSKFPPESQFRGDNENSSHKQAHDGSGLATQGTQEDARGECRPRTARPAHQPTGDQSGDEGASREGSGSRILAVDAGPGERRGHKNRTAARHSSTEARVGGAKAGGGGAGPSNPSTNEGAQAGGGVDRGGGEGDDGRACGEACDGRNDVRCPETTRTRGHQADYSIHDHQHGSGRENQGRTHAGGLAMGARHTPVGRAEGPDDSSSGSARGKQSKGKGDSNRPRHPDDHGAGLRVGGGDRTAQGGDPEGRHSGQHQAEQGRSQGVDGPRTASEVQEGQGKGGEVGGKQSRDQQEGGEAAVGLSLLPGRVSGEWPREVAGKGQGHARRESTGHMDDRGHRRGGARDRRVGERVGRDMGLREPKRVSSAPAPSSCGNLGQQAGGQKGGGERVLLRNRVAAPVRDLDKPHGRGVDAGGLDDRLQALQAQHQAPKAVGAEEGQRGQASGSKGRVHRGCDQKQDPEAAGSGSGGGDAGGSPVPRPRRGGRVRRPMARYQPGVTTWQRADDDKQLEQSKKGDGGDRTEASGAPCYAYTAKNKRIKLSAAILVAYVVIEPIARELVEGNGGLGKSPRKRGADWEGNEGARKAPRLRGAEEESKWGDGNPGPRKAPRRRGAGLGLGVRVRARAGRRQEAHEDGRVLDPG